MMFKRSQTVFEVSMKYLGMLALLSLTACSSLSQVEVSDSSESPELVAPGIVLIERNPWSEASGMTMPNKESHVGTDLNAATKDANTQTADWSHFPFPGKAATSYRYTKEEGRDAMLAQSKSSSSMIRRHIQIASQDLGSVNFSWKVPELIHGCDISVAAKDDSPVRILLTFEGDRAKFSAKNAILSELANLLLGEPMPYATLVYVWSNEYTIGSIIHGARTDRVRSIVVESGERNLNHWMDYERHIRADFEQAFGEAPGALLSVAIMTDSDNNKSQTSAWYGPLSFTAAAPQNK